MECIESLKCTDALVKSPSSTSLYLTCPQQWVFAKEFPLVNEGILKGRKVAQWMERMAKPIVSFGKVEPEDDGLFLACVKAQGFLEEKFPLPQEAEVVFGKARVDRIIGFDKIIIDFKYTNKLDLEYLHSKFQSYYESWQLYHYAWCVMSERGNWVKEFMDIGIMLISDKPKPSCKLHTWAVSRGEVLAWLENAVKVWQMMEEGRVWKNYNSCFIEKYNSECFWYRKCKGGSQGVL